MNRYERPLPAGNEAVIQFASPENKVIRNGSFVRCAVTAQPIALEDLKYWSVELQEAYASPAAMWTRYINRPRVNA